jgi:hypothetical protein
MRHFVVWGVFLLPLAFFLSCDSESVVEPEELEPPANLAVTDISSTGGQITLEWDGAVGEYVGYRIYQHTERLEFYDDPEELAPYMIQEVGAATQSTTVDLGDSYTYYYVHVRAYTEENDVSEASNEPYIIARPLDEGAVVYEFSSPAGNPSGFDLSAGTAVSMATTNPDRHDLVDFFLGYSEGTSGNGDLYLWDPKEASSDYQNTTGFLGVSESFDELDAAPTGANYADHVAITVGAVVAVMITDEFAITHYGKLEFTRIDGTEPNRTLVFKWAYQPEPGRPELVPQP